MSFTIFGFVFLVYSIMFFPLIKKRMQREQEEIKKWKDMFDLMKK